MTILDIDRENPLIWPLLTILQQAQQSYKINNLAYELQLKGWLSNLDEDPHKALFKQNFLIMNALYQLQRLLQPAQWLQVQAMDIQLFTQRPTNFALLFEQDSALRDYYLDWQHFETSSGEIEELLSGFWSRYSYYQGGCENKLNKSHALQVFELAEEASEQDIRRQWRKLALKWHPDRISGDAQKFRDVCAAWQTLRNLKGDGAG